MKVSIIMCSYNVEAFIEKAIQSILKQTYTDWELIIADDKSADSTTDIVKTHLHDKRIRYYPNEKNMGYVRNKNNAFKYAQGDLLTQLDSDDTCPPDRIEKQVSVFLQHKDINVCGTNYRLIDQYDNPLPAKEYREDFLVKEITEDCPFWFPGLMFRKEVVEQYGLFSEYFAGTYGDDNYWTIRVVKKNPIYFIKDILYNYRINPGSITNVFDNPRKMIVSEILQELGRQQREGGTDWLEQAMPEKMQQYEQELLSDKTLMSKKYREWAAKAIDKNDFNKAKTMLAKSFDLNKMNLETYRTFLYYLKKRLKS